MAREFCPYCMAPVEPGEACAVCGLTYGNYTPAPHHLPPGTVLKERYLVGRVLGEGGFGITYIGCDLRLELKVAIKEYFPTDKANRVSQATLSVSSYTGAAGSRYEEGKERFLQEARTMARMDKQPVIVSVRDFFETNNTAYIVMEYVEGTTFKDLVAQKGGRIPAGELLHMMEPLFFALGAMHDAGLIHRDISPENLMLENGEIRLLDFGCARQSSKGDETLTIALKHGYAPVEQYQNKGQGPWTDVYALSATIYYCLTGKKPPQSMDRLVEDELVLPRKLGVDLTEKQERALLYGMGVRPRRRFQSVRELHTALYEGGEVPGYEPKPEPPKPKPPAPEPVSPAPDMDRTENRTHTVSQAGAEKSKPEKDSGDKLRGWLSKYWRLALGGAAAVVILVLAVALWPRDDTPDDPGEDQQQTDIKGQTSDDSAAPATISEIFSGAASLNNMTDASETESELRRLLADDTVPAVVIRQYNYVDITGEPLEITKPLLIQAEAGLTSSQPITVSGKGAVYVCGGLNANHLLTVSDTGTITVSGVLCIDYGMLRTTGGGSVTVKSGGELTGCTLAWLENQADLTVEEGGRAAFLGVDYGSERSQERFLVLNEEEIFADATHVSSFAEYQNAIRSPSTRAIVIDSDMTITSEDRAHNVPVLISEGVTVTAPSYNFDFAASGSWCVDRAVLINYGTIEGAFQTGDWDDDGQEDFCAVVNYGTIGGEMHLDCPGSFINLGDVNITAAQVIRTNVYNLGRLDHVTSEQEDTFLDFGGPMLCSWGEMTVAGESARESDPLTNLKLANGTWFINSGTLTIGAGGALENRSHISNLGQILVTDPTARLDNAAYLDTSAPGSVVDFHPDSTLGHGGLIQQGESSTVNLPDNIEAWDGAIGRFGWNDDHYDVTTAQALRQAQEGKYLSTGYPAVDSADVTVNGDLTVERTMAVGGGTLTIQNGNLTISGQDTFFMGTVDLGGGTLTLTDGAVMVGSVSNCSGLIIKDQAKLVQRDWPELTPGAAVELDNGGTLISFGLELRETSVRIGAYSVFRSCGWLGMDGCTVDIGENGELLNDASDIFLDESTTVTNRGDFAVNGWEWQDMELAGTAANYGRMELHASIRITGSLTNYGTIKTGADIPVYGALDNQGTVENYNGSRFVETDGGTVTGSPAQDRGPWPY